MSIILLIISLFMIANSCSVRTKPLTSDNKQVVTVFDPIDNRYINITVKKEDMESEKSGSAIIFGDMGDLNDDNSISDEDRHALANFGKLTDDIRPKKSGFGDVKRIYGYGESTGVGSGIVEDPLMGLAA